MLFLRLIFMIAVGIRHLSTIDIQTVQVYSMLSL